MKTQHNFYNHNNSYQSLQRSANTKRIVGVACRTVWEEKRHLLEVVREMVGEDTAVNWDTIPDEAHYLGEASTFIDQVLRALAKLPTR